MPGSMELPQLLATHVSYLEQTSNGKVRCRLTGHEMPPDAGAVKAHLQSRHFAKARERAEAVNQYGDNFDVSSDKPGMLVCKVTGKLVNAKPEAVAKHLAGKKYQRALAASHSETQPQTTTSSGGPDWQPPDGEEVAMEGVAEEEPSSDDEDADGMANEGRLHRPTAAKRRTAAGGASKPRKKKAKS
eukprot:jgi/Chlat1/3871/Chrsp26S00305